MKKKTKIEILFNAFILIGCVCGAGYVIGRFECHVAVVVLAGGLLAGWKYTGL